MEKDQKVLMGRHNLERLSGTAVGNPACWCFRHTKPYLLALATEPSGTGVLEPLQGFMTNPAGAAVVNAIGPIRQVVRDEDKIRRRYLVILPGTPDNHGAPIQVQRE
jgi:hypothetical protein